MLTLGPTTRINNKFILKTYYGNENDTPPTGGDLANGSVFCQMTNDGLKVKFYDAETAAWR